MSETVKTEYKVYLAGELFDLKHLAGNALLAQEIERASKGRFSMVLPQNLELPSLQAKAIRDADYVALLNSDVAVFQFDGSDLDSGTVAEFMAAKMVDIPSVILRTDFRRSGDRSERPWNLMCDSFPRTENLVVDAMALYSEIIRETGLSPVEAIGRVVGEMASLLIEKLNRALLFERILDPEETRISKVLLQKCYDLKI